MRRSDRTLMSSAASAVREGLSLALQAAPGSCSSRAPALDPFVIRRSQTTERRRGDSDEGPNGPFLLIAPTFYRH